MSRTSSAAPARAGSGRSRAGRAAWQASSAVVRERVGLEPRDDGLDRGDALGRIAAGQGELSRQNLGRQVGQHLALAHGDGRFQVVDLAGAHGRGCQQRSDALRAAQRRARKRRGVKKDLGRPRRRQDGVAQCLVNGLGGHMMLLPDALELDQVGDDARGGLVDGTVVD